RSACFRGAIALATCLHKRRESMAPKNRQVLANSTTAIKPLVIELPVFQLLEKICARDNYGSLPSRQRLVGLFAGADGRCGIEGAEGRRRAGYERALGPFRRGCPGGARHAG